MGAMVAVAAGGMVAVAAGAMVAVGVEDAHADRTSINTSMEENKILFFITFLLGTILRHI
jgi:zinc transporter ZupT